MVHAEVKVKAKNYSKGEKNHPRGRRFSNPFKGEGRWIEK